MVAGSAACLSGTLPPIERYRLPMPDTTRGSSDSGPLPVVAEQTRLDGSLAVAPYVVPGIYGDPNIVYRIDETQYGTYPNRQWVLPLRLMLGELTERVLLASPLSVERATYAPPSRVAHPYEWQGTVREFEEVNRGRTVLVSVALDARIVRTADEVIIWEGSARVEHPVPDPTMPAIVEALAESSAEVVRRLVAQARIALEPFEPPGSR